MEDTIFQQCSIFDDVLPRFQITKKVRLIEFFSGIGSQAKALEILNVPFEHYKTCEWAFNSYCAYNSIHIKDNNDYTENLSKEQLIAKVNGTSINYNEPLTTEQLNKKPIEWLKKAYNNIVATHNLVNIMNVKGQDLEITETDKYDYILTYSFPCQDLSLAGLRKGMSVSQKYGGTRSGLLWEVERILAECKELGSLPNVLVMENVPEVCGSKNVRDFEKWQTRLQEFGYSNYSEILNAKDYGIPQNRRRCFMVSILGNYNYTFPKKMPLKLRLKDLLEENVDEKYYLSQKMLNYIYSDESAGKYHRKAARECSDRNYKNGITVCISTRSGSRPTDNFIPIKNANSKGYELAEDGDGIDISSRMESHRGTVQKGTSQTLTCQGGNNVGVVVNLIKAEREQNLDTEIVGGVGDKKSNGGTRSGLNASMKVLYEELPDTTNVRQFGNKALNETLEKNKVENGDFLDCYNRDNKKDIAATITTRVSESNMTFVAERCAKEKLCNDFGVAGVVIKDDSVYTELEKKLFTEDGNVKRYIDSDIVDEFKEGQMANTSYPHGYGHGPRTHDESITLTRSERPSVKCNLRIRKLTPKECFMLMGFTKNDCENVNQSDTSLYHLAGDSIVSTVLVAIFSNMINELNTHESIINNYVEKELL